MARGAWPGPAAAPRAAALADKYRKEDAAAKEAEEWPPAEVSASSLHLITVATTTQG